MRPTRCAALAAVGVSALALAGDARADVRAAEDTVLLGLGVGSAEYVVMEDPGYAGMLLSGFGGLRTGAHSHLVFRVSHYGGEQEDPFDPVVYDHSHWRLVPGFRLGGRYAWAELGLGVARDSYTRSDFRTDEDTTSPTVSALFGFSAAPRTWPVRPHVEAGLALGPGITASIGLAVVYQPPIR